MIKERPRHTPILPPPAETILLYAADGLSCWRGHLSPAARPIPPCRSVWVPMFRQLVDSAEGLETLHALAEAGMRAWNCSPDVIACLDDAVVDITFRAFSIAALEHLAATAYEKVSLPPPVPPHHRQTSKTKPNRFAHHRTDLLHHRAAAKAAPQP